jgi:DNA-binding response OmpR family regulator
MSVEVPVLVVDDERDMANVFADAIEIAGYEAKVCYRSDTALKEFENRLILPNVVPYAMLIADWKMGPIDGLQLTREVRKRDDSIVIVLTTGHTDAIMNCTEARRMGVDEFLFKPFDIADFDAILERMPTARAASRQLLAQIGQA